MTFEILVEDKWKNCNFTERVTTFPFAQRWICDHCNTELNYRPVSIQTAINIYKNNQTKEE